MDRRGRLTCARQRLQAVEDGLAASGKPFAMGAGEVAKARGAGFGERQQHPPFVVRIALAAHQPRLFESAGQLHRAVMLQHQLVGEGTDAHGLPCGGANRQQGLKPLGGHAQARADLLAVRHDLPQCAPESRQGRKMGVVERLVRSASRRLHLTPCPDVAPAPHRHKLRTVSRRSGFHPHIYIVPR